MTLEQLLTEEDRASILTEVERERRRVLVTRMYEEGMRSDNIYVRQGTAKSLGALAQVDPIKFIALYETGINDENSIVRFETAGTLAALASINLNKFVELYEKGINNKERDVRMETAKTLAVLLSINPNMFVELYKKGTNDRDIRIVTDKILDALALNDSNTFVELYEKLYGKKINDEEWYVTEETDKTLATQALINPDKSVALVEKGTNDDNEIVRFETDETLVTLVKIHLDKFIELYQDEINDKDYQDWDVITETTRILYTLALINPTKFVELVERWINDDNDNVRIGTVGTLGALTLINPDKFVELYQKGINDKDKYVRWITAETLGAFVPINSERFVELYEKGIIDDNYDVRSGTAKTLSALASINPDKFVELYIKGINNKNENVIWETAKTLATLASTIQEPILKPLKDEEYNNFLIAFLSSKYIQNPDGTLRTKGDIQQELVKLVRNSEGLDYQRLQRILDAGQAKDLDEMVECSNINLLGFEVIKKLGEGGSRETYLLRHNSSDILLVGKRLLDKPKGKAGKDQQTRHSRKDIQVREFSEFYYLKDYSPNIVKIFPPVENDDEIWAIEEYVEGKNLEERMHSLDYIKMIKVFSKMMDSVEYLHKHHKVSRDLKLDNVLVSNDLSDVKLTDFQFIVDEKEIQKEERTSTGSDRYKAPELVREEIKSANFQTDIYSLCACFYYLRTGETQSLGTINHLPSYEYNKALDHLLEDRLSPIERNFLRRGLSYNRDERYKTVKEMKDAFKEIQGELYRFLYMFNKLHLYDELSASDFDKEHI